MSDIPLRTFGRSRNSRSGYTPLNTEQDEYGASGDGVNSNNQQTMPLQANVTMAAVSGAQQNHQRRKGKKKQTYQDDPEEHEGLLADDQGGDSEGEVERPGPARLPAHEVRSTPCYLTLSHIQQRSTSRSSSSRKHAGGSKDKSRTVPFRPPGVLRRQCGQTHSSKTYSF